MLIEAGADVNIRDNYNRTALIIAAIYNRVNPLKKILEKTININLLNDQGKTAKDIAKESNYTHFVKIIEEEENRRRNRIKPAKRKAK